VRDTYAAVNPPAHPRPRLHCASSNIRFEWRRAHERLRTLAGGHNELLHRGFNDNTRVRVRVRLPAVAVNPVPHARCMHPRRHLRMRGGRCVIRGSMLVVSGGVSARLASPCGQRTMITWAFSPALTRTHATRHKFAAPNDPHSNPSGLCVHRFAVYARKAGFLRPGAVERGGGGPTRWDAGVPGDMRDERAIATGSAWRLAWTERDSGGGVHAGRGGWETLPRAWTECCPGLRVRLDNRGENRRGGEGRRAGEGGVASSR
jgi:hypothetical protein